MREVALPERSLDRFGEIIGAQELASARDLASELRDKLGERRIWNVNSTETGGGVAELLRPLVGYGRGAGISTHWLTIDGSPEFFAITKRLHHALHGMRGDGRSLGRRSRSVYERTLRPNAAEIAQRVRPGDVVILHDPQTAGLVPHVDALGCVVIWRCHVGDDHGEVESDRAWRFLNRYLRRARALVFSREAFIPPRLRERAHVITPSIDPFSAKNQPLDDDTVRSILVHAGLLEGPAGPASPSFMREDGSPGRCTRFADVLRLGRAPRFETPLVVQVSRWDRLKDPIGVIEGFGRLDASTGAHLVLAGPNVHAVADDPEGDAVFDEVISFWRALPHETRHRVQLASLPMADLEENGAIVNALQRHAAIVVQKSLREGFGLTVTEAMWKGRPVVAGGVGGILDQIEDGVSGVLLDDPADLDAFARALARILGDAKLAARLGEAARERVRARFVGIRSLTSYAHLIAKLLE